MGTIYVNLALKPYVHYTTMLQVTSTRDHSLLHTVKPFNLAALKIGDFRCKIILAPFILAKSNNAILTCD